MIIPNWKFITSRLDYFFAFGMGAGLSPRAPGTVGTLVGFPLYFLLSALLSLKWVLVTLSLLYILGIFICDSAGKAVGHHDHSGIVWDEIVAMVLVLCFTPHSTLGYWGAFLVFRFFDIVKPWPINLIDKYMEGGNGVMLDDLLAAIYSIVLIQSLSYVVS